MISAIQYVFSSISSSFYDVDERLPILSVSLGGKSWGFFGFDVLLWIQLLVIISIFEVFSVVMATITYYVIIPRRGSLLSYLIGFGFIIPMCAFYFPFFVLDALDVRNKLMRFCGGSIYPVITMFHTSEAMFGFSPPSVEASLSNYILYYAAVVDVQYDTSHKPIKATMDDTMKLLKSAGYYAFMLSCFQSIFGPIGYEPFHTNANGNEPGFKLEHFYDFNLFRNNIISTILLQLYLSTFLALLSAIVTIKYKVKVREWIMNDPLLSSASPSDFWSGRWNLVIHGALKRGVFKPIYKISSNKFVAVMGTFLFSGLLHEYILIVIHPPHLNFKPSLGKETAFMMWNAGLICIEVLIGHLTIFSWIKNHLPKPLVSILVICTAMPVAHWFLHPISKSDMLTVHGTMAFPMIKLIE